MSGGTRRGGIPGPESRTGLVRPAMTEAEFERRQPTGPPSGAQALSPASTSTVGPELGDPPTAGDPEPSGRGGASSRGRAPRVKPQAKPRRVQRMFALEEDLDKKLWLYAIHMGKDRSEVVNDLLRPIVASMVLYDSRDRRAARALEPTAERATDQDGEAA